MTRGAASMLVAAALWGAVGGVISGLHVSGAAAAAAVELGTGIVLLGLGAVGGRSPIAAFRCLGTTQVLLLGFIEAINVLCYYVALQWAPVGPAMAVHLLAPVLLAAYGLIRGSIAATAKALAAIILTVAALVLLAASRGHSAAYPLMIPGLALSFASAVCLAVFISLVRASAASVSPMAAAGAQMLLSGLLLCPALLTLQGDSVPMLAVSVLLFAPACGLYWLGMRTLTPISAGTILLAEPIFGSLAAFTVYGVMPTALQAVAALAILAATYMSL